LAHAGKKASERAIEPAPVEQSSSRAVEQSSNRAIEQSSNRAIEQSSNRAIEQSSNLLVAQLYSSIYFLQSTSGSLSRKE